MHFVRIGHNRGHYARLDDDYLYEGKIWRCTRNGDRCRINGPFDRDELRETPYRMRRHPLLYSPCLLSLLRHDTTYLCLVQKSLSIRVAQMRV